MTKRKDVLQAVKAILICQGALINGVRSPEPFGGLSTGLIEDPLWLPTVAALLHQDWVYTRIIWLTYSLMMPSLVSPAMFLAMACFSLITRIAR